MVRTASADLRGSRLRLRRQNVRQDLQDLQDKRQDFDPCRKSRQTDLDMMELRSGAFDLY